MRATGVPWPDDATTSSVVVVVVVAAVVAVVAASVAAASVAAAAAAADTLPKTSWETMSSPNDDGSVLALCPATAHP
jgi:hypothetical protein